MQEATVQEPLHQYADKCDNTSATKSRASCFSSARAPHFQPAASQVSQAQMGHARSQLARIFHASKSAAANATKNKAEGGIVFDVKVDSQPLSLCESFMGSC